MRALFFPIVLCALAVPVCVHSMEVIGYAGYLGEWELTASVTENAAHSAKEFSGPLTMTHVGICTQDGPEKKTGEIHLQLSQRPARLQATLLVDGVECSYSGRLADSYTGEMACPHRAAMPLVLWGN